MKTIRKYAEAGYDYHALTADEQDAILREAQLLADAQRNAAIRAMYRKIARTVSRWLSPFSADRCG